MTRNRPWLKHGASNSTWRPWRLLALCVFLGWRWRLTIRPTRSTGWSTRRLRRPATPAAARGAIAADLLLQGFGVGAYYLVGSLAMLDAWLLARRPVTQPVLRAIGWVMSLLALCTLTSLATSWSPGPVIGPADTSAPPGAGCWKCTLPAPAPTS